MRDSSGVERPRCQKCATTTAAARVRTHFRTVRDANCTETRDPTPRRLRRRISNSATPRKLQNAK
eukprot:2684195-Lingulodinium_polyedra.AAC.1